MSALVPIIMGSKSDLAHGQAIASALSALGIDSAIRTASAHKVPRYLFDLLTVYSDDPRVKAYITVAGRSNALSGVVDGFVTVPVIACPPPSDSFGGADIYSSLRMPSGITPAVILDPGNAALFAAKIVGLTDPEVLARVRALQMANAKRVIDDDKELNESK
ncbi:MAG: AIR carboxylase family protein [Chloroflexota bacterium]|nr:AIR carboxylase family protein [Chloroflexota bacterium]